MVAFGNFFFHWRNVLFPFACLLVVVPSPWITEDPLDAGLAGFAVGAVGQCIRALTIGYQYVIRGGRAGRVFAEDLVTGGIYHLTRNPMYVGNVVILAGLALASNSWLCVAVLVPFFVFVYVAIVAAEEAFLRNKFGTDFARYCASTARWLPSPRALARFRPSGPFHWKRVVLKEYGTPVGWITMMFGMVAFQLHRTGRWDEGSDALAVVLVPYFALLVAYLTVRHQKLTRRWVAD